MAAAYEAILPRENQLDSLVVVLRLNFEFVPPSHHF